MTKNLWCICRDVFKSSVHKREWLISWLSKLVWNVLNIMQLRITLRSTSSIDILTHLYRCAYITYTCKPLLSAVTLAGNIIYTRRFLKCIFFCMWVNILWRLNKLQSQPRPICIRKGKGPAWDRHLWHCKRRLTSVVNTSITHEDWSAHALTDM